MAVSGGFFVDRRAQLEASLNAVGSHIENGVQTVGNLLVGEVDVACAIGVDEEAHRLSHADSVSHLHENFVGNAGSYSVFSHVASSVGSRTVDLAWVLARESTAAVSAATSVGVDDDFAAGETRVAVRTTDNELSGGVDVVGDIVVEQSLNVGGERSLNARHEYVLHIVVDGA